MAKSSSKKNRSAQRALMKPFEVVAIALACGIFVFGVVMLTVQDWLLGLIFAGISIVVVLLVLALLLLSYKPNPDVPVYLDRQLYDSKEPGAQDAALRVVESYDEQLPREEDEDTEDEPTPAQGERAAQSNNPAQGDQADTTEITKDEATEDEDNNR
ncbi:MAG: hypothetical protein ACTHXA_05470 [Gulosibacter sp.]|uniref:hypothetical protein n=1 Tax=Gulosibacter sp. TaxID=2817531 RepID=UPI003F8FAD33